MEDASVVPGNRNLASSYVPGDFTEELLDRGTISISDFSETRRIVISRTCPPSFAAMRIPSCWLLAAAADARLVAVVIPRISDCYSNTGRSTGKFVVSRTLM